MSHPVDEGIGKHIKLWCQADAAWLLALTCRRMLQPSWDVRNVGPHVSQHVCQRCITMSGAWCTSWCHQVWHTSGETNGIHAKIQTTSNGMQPTSFHFRLCQQITRSQQRRTTKFMAAKLQPAVGRGVVLAVLRTARS